MNGYREVGSLPESIEVAKVLQRAGVAALDISQCIQESPGAGFDPMQYPEGWTVFASEAIKKAVTDPRDHTATPCAIPSTANKYSRRGRRTWSASLGSSWRTRTGP